MGVGSGLRGDAFLVRCNVLGHRDTAAAGLDGNHQGDSFVKSACYQRRFSETRTACHHNLVRCEGGQGFNHIHGPHQAPSPDAERHRVLRIGRIPRRPEVKDAGEGDLALLRYGLRIRAYLRVASGYKGISPAEEIIDGVVVAQLSGEQFAAPVGIGAVAADAEFGFLFHPAVRNDHFRIGNEGVIAPVVEGEDDGHGPGCAARPYDKPVDLRAAPVLAEPHPVLLPYGIDPFDNGVAPVYPIDEDRLRRGNRPIHLLLENLLDLFAAERPVVGVPDGRPACKDQRVFRGEDLRHFDRQVLDKGSAVVSGGRVTSFDAEHNTVSVFHGESFCGERLPFTRPVEREELDFLRVGCGGVMVEIRAVTSDVGIRSVEDGDAPDAGGRVGNRAGVEGHIDSGVSASGEAEFRREDPALCAAAAELQHTGMNVDIAVTGPAFQAAGRKGGGLLLEQIGRCAAVGDECAGAVGEDSGVGRFESGAPGKRVGVPSQLAEVFGQRDARSRDKFGQLLDGECLGFARDDIGSLSGAAVGHLQIVVFVRREPGEYKTG